MFPALAADQRVEPLLAEVTEVADLHSRATVTRAERVTAGLLGLGFAAFAAACASQAPSPHWKVSAIAVGLVAVYALAHRTKFEAATGSTVPTEPVLVALVFSVPIAAVPALVLAGLLLGGPWRSGPGGPRYQLLV
ncbi:MAG TPA: hypothetical protein VK425_01400, partial [Acidimicrobiales bacterium]|nr:hypothetical protein [Acidimicrobiales bacterium]